MKRRDESPDRRQTRAERAGDALGRAVGPLFAAITTLRRARTFHPRGDCADAVVEVTDDVAADYRRVAERLAGNAFVRLSDALTKGKARWPDVLGCAIRFGGSYPVEEGSQDLLFATIKRPWTMPFSPLTTHVGDYFANDYFAVSPFSINAGPRIYLRLRPERSPTVEAAIGGRGAADRRRRRLERAIASGSAVFVLGVGQGPRGPFAPIASIRLVSIWQRDPPELRFNPFRSGAGIEPRGLVHALRRGAYPASQRAR